MRLISKDVYYNDLPLGILKDSRGTTLTPPLLSFINGTYIPIQSFTFDSRKNMYQINFDTAVEVSVGDVVTLTDGVFPLEVYVAKVSLDKKVILLPQDKKLYNVEIENITEVKLNRKFKLSVNVEDGVYYTDNGEMIFVSNAFDFSKLLPLSLIRVIYPIFREGKATEDWELITLKEVAYLKVMNRLSMYASRITDNFKYLDTGLIKEMILKQLAILYQEALPSNELLENKKLIKLESDLNELFRALVKVFSINEEDGSINNVAEDLTLLEF